MYIVLEMQTNNGKVSILPYQFEDVFDAEAKYHSILAAAAKSRIAVHTAMIMTEYGFVLKEEHYEHQEEA